MLCGASDDTNGAIGLPTDELFEVTRDGGILMPAYLGILVLP